MELLSGVTHSKWDGSRWGMREKNKEKVYRARQRHISLSTGHQAFRHTGCEHLRNSQSSGQQCASKNSIDSRGKVSKDEIQMQRRSERSSFWHMNPDYEGNSMNLCPWHSFKFTTTSSLHFAHMLARSRTHTSLFCICVAHVTSPWLRTSTSHHWHF